MHLVLLPERTHIATNLMNIDVFHSSNSKIGVLPFSVWKTNLHGFGCEKIGTQNTEMPFFAKQ